MALDLESGSGLDLVLDSGSMLESDSESVLESVLESEMDSESVLASGLMPGWRWDFRSVRRQAR